MLEGLNGGGGGGGGGGTKQLSSQWGAMCLTTPIVSDWDLADGGHLGAILGRGPVTQRLVTILILRQTTTILSPAYYPRIMWTTFLCHHGAVIVEDTHTPLSGTRE